MKLSIILLPLVTAVIAGSSAFGQKSWPRKVQAIGSLVQPFSIVFDPSGILYGVEYEEGNRIFRLKNGTLEFIAGSRTPGGQKLGDVASGDGGPAQNGRFNGM
ncbi:MAG: hypothetical protein ACJAVK_001074, partial [Akkermansiaceae bacterium]